MSDDRTDGADGAGERGGGTGPVVVDGFEGATGSTGAALPDKHAGNPGGGVGVGCRCHGASMCLFGLVVNWVDRERLVRRGW